MKWENRGHEFDNRTDIIVQDNIKYYVWGAAVGGKSFYQSYKDEINIIGFIDSDKNKQGKNIDGVPIYSPEILESKEENIKILVASAWNNQIFEYLEQRNFVYQKDFFMKDEFITLFMLKKHDKLYWTILTYVITSKCTLRCKYCASFIPYYENSSNEEVPVILESLENYFRYVDNLSLFALTGGDTFLHPKFDELLEEIGERYYNKKIQTIAVGTNAIIMPTQSRIKLLQKYNVIVRFTEYTKALHKQNIPEFCKILKDNNIRYECITFDKWANIGYPQESNGLTEENDKIDLFTNCRRSCVNLYKNSLCYCGIAFRADELNYAPLGDGDVLDLTDTSIRKEELLEFMLGYHPKGYLNLCTKCNGGLNANDYLVEVGEQLP